jgi:hypothetical protein
MSNLRINYIYAHLFKYARIKIYQVYKIFIIYNLLITEMLNFIQIK